MTPVNVLQTITLWSGGLVLSRAPRLVACMSDALHITSCKPVINTRLNIQASLSCYMYDIAGHIKPGS